MAWFNKNKAFRYAAACCLAFVLLATGCSSGTDNDPGAGQQTNGPTEGGAKELPAVTLKWFIMGDKQQGTDAVFNHFNERLQDYLPNTKVEFEVVAQAEYAERWELAAASGEKFDLAWTGYVHDYADQVKKGAYLPIDELFEQYGQDIRNEVPDWVFDFSRVEGQLYAIPSYKDMFDLRIGLRTPKELANKYWDYEQAEKQFFSREGREWTRADYDVLEDYMQQLKDAGELKLGISDAIFSRLNNGVPLAGGHNGPFSIRENDDTYTVQLRFESPAIKLYYDVMAEWFKKGFIRSDVLSNQNRRQDEGQPEGYTLWFHTSYRDQSDIESDRFSFPIEVIPVEKDWRVLPGTASSATAIPRTAQNPERAMMLMNLMNSSKGKELNNIIIFGIEGVHYNKIGENRIERIKDSQNGVFNIFVPGNQFNAYETVTQAEGYHQYIKEVQESAIVSPLVGFIADVSKVQAEFAQLNAIATEYQGLNLGALNDHQAKYEEFIQKLHNAGSDKVKAELQRQVDEFLKSKGINVPSR